MGIYEDRIFPWLLDVTTQEGPIRDLTAQALSKARGDVLEIGFGSGRTLPLYPGAVTCLSAVEPSGGMSRRAARRIAEARFPVELHRLKGERLPFEDARFDTIVIVLTLCTVEDPDAVLAEAKRVLKPGGVLLFFEHGLSPVPKWARWQHRLDPVQRVLGCGCNLTREPVRILERAGFGVDVDYAGTVEGMPGPKHLLPVVLGQARSRAQGEQGR